jgi:transcriptional regulator
MFVRPCWKPRTQEELYRFIEEYPWALLVNNAANGPLVTNMPFLLDRSKGNFGTLVGHVARGNEHAAVLSAAESPTLVVFQGPYSYVTASWYPQRDMPSTYYYTAVHCYGHIRVQSDAELETWLGKLTERMETPLPNGWKTTDIPRSEITRRLPAIMGFELEIERIEGKFKLGQDEPKKDAMAVAQKLENASDPSHRKLSEMIRAYNEDRAER